MPPLFVDARDLAERLDVSYDTVLSWVRRGKVPHVRDGHGRLIFNLNSVIESLRERRPQSEAARPDAETVHKHERPQPEARGAGDDPRQDHPTPPPAAVKGQPAATDQPEGLAMVARQELAATSRVLSDDFEREPPPAEEGRAFRNQETARRCGIRAWLIERLLVVRKFAGGRVMKPDALVGAAYIAMSAARATLAPDQAEILSTVMDLAIAMIYLAKPYLHKDERLQSRIEH